MTIDQMIELAVEAREDLGGDAQVRIAYQRGYPLRAALDVTTPGRAFPRMNTLAAQSLITVSPR